MHFENIAKVVNEHDYKKLKENDLKLHFYWTEFPAEN